MSLLPQQIPPQTAPVVREINGQLLLDKNWWLFLYNIAQSVLGTDGGLPPSALIELAGADTDAVGADTAVLRAPIRNLEVQIEGPSDPINLGPLSLLATDALLPDPLPQAQPAKSISVGASTFTYTAPADGTVVVTGGPASSITYVRQGTSIATGLIVGAFPVSRLDQLQVAYGGSAPTMTFLPR